jgi:hypothetical protein
VSTNPQFPMHTLSKFKSGIARFHGVVEKAGRDPSQITLALRVLAGPAARPRVMADGEPRLFTGGSAEYAADIRALEELGVGAIDVRLFGASTQETVDNMRRFRDEVMAKVR